jgi:hypothetical protein
MQITRCGWGKPKTHIKLLSNFYILNNKNKKANKILFSKNTLASQSISTALPYNLFFVGFLAMRKKKYQKNFRLSVATKINHKDQSQRSIREIGQMQ